MLKKLNILFIVVLTASSAFADTDKTDCFLFYENGNFTKTQFNEKETPAVLIDKNKRLVAIIYGVNTSNREQLRKLTDTQIDAAKKLCR